MAGSLFLLLCCGVLIAWGICTSKKIQLR